MALPRLLGNPRLRRLLGLGLTAQGLLGFLAPRLTAKLGARLWLREAYENPGDLEPTDDYVGLIRDASLATLVFGTLTLLRAGTAATGPESPSGEGDVDGAESEDATERAESDVDDRPVDTDTDTDADTDDD